MTPSPRVDVVLRRRSGFTLLEAAILLLVAVVLAALLWPRYQAWQRAEYRAQARTALTELAHRLERRHRETGTYAGAAVRDGRAVATGSPAVMPAAVPADGGAARYRLRIVTANAHGYEIQAVPVAGQRGDRCGTLTLTAAGVRGIQGEDPGTLIADCWKP